MLNNDKFISPHSTMEIVNIADSDKGEPEQNVVIDMSQPKQAELAKELKKAKIESQGSTYLDTRVRRASNKLRDHLWCLANPNSGLGYAPDDWTPGK